MEPEQIRMILDASPEKLKKVARKLEISLPVALELRMQAINLLMGKCVLCETPSSRSLCFPCKKKAEEQEDKVVLVTTRDRVLRGLNPQDVLIRRGCATCGNEFTQIVDSVIRNLLNTGRPFIASTCRKCRANRKRLTTLQTQSKKPVEVTEEDLKALQAKLKDRRFHYTPPKK